MSSPAAVDEVVRGAVKAGGRVIKEPQQASFGGYHGHVADPNGVHPARRERQSAQFPVTLFEHLCDSGPMPAHGLAWQTTLTSSIHPAIDSRLSGLRTFRLDDASWVEFVPNWVPGGDSLLAELVAHAPWQPQKTRVMWDQLVREPRILARWPDLSTLPGPVSRMRAVLSSHYGVDFNLVAVNLYRDGADSVAWHGDRVRLTHKNPLVATVSLGEPRPFLMRRRGGGPAALKLRLGGGDLLVMAGACQHDWDHCVPKVSYAGARMSITFRHTVKTHSWSR